MDVTYGAKTPAGGYQSVVGLYAGQLADTADGHRGGRGGVRHPHGHPWAGAAVVAVVKFSLQRRYFNHYFRISSFSNLFS